MDSNPARFARQRAATRRLYTLELRAPLPMRLRRPRSIDYLRTLLRRVWHEQAHPHLGRCPLLIAGRGLRCGPVWRSYCEGRSCIVLARHERNSLVLLHEAAHALGPWTHGRRFVRRYLLLLSEYVGVNPLTLALLAYQFGVQV